MFKSFKNKLLITAMIIGIIGLFTNPLFVGVGTIIALTGIFIKE